MKISKHKIDRALKRLGELLEQRNKKFDLTVGGGVISLFYFRSRQMTKDVDAVFPDSPADRELLKDLINQVASELKLPDEWLNDSISFFGLETESDVIIFRHSHLRLRAAKWEELLAHKIHAFRRKEDINDARLILSEIRGFSKEKLFEELKKYEPISPHVPSDIFRKRFEELWQEISE